MSHFVFWKPCCIKNNKVAYDLLQHVIAVTGYVSNLKVNWKCIWGHKHCKGFKILSFIILAQVGYLVIYLWYHWYYTKH